MPNKLAGYSEALMSRWDVARRFNVELKDCPFCGGAPYLHLGPSPHTVCGACAAEGPVFEAKGRELEERQYEAVVAWNNRV